MQPESRPRNTPTGPPNNLNGTAWQEGLNTLGGSSPQSLTPGQPTVLQPTDASPPNPSGSAQFFSQLPPIPMAAVASPASPPSSHKKTFILTATTLCAAVVLAVGIVVFIMNTKPDENSTKQQPGSKQVVNPLQPTNLVYSILTGTSITVGWDSAKTASSYTLSYSMDETFTTGVQTKDNISSSPVTLANLAEGETYYFRVTAHKSDGTSATSKILVVTMVD